MKITYKCIKSTKLEKSNGYVAIILETIVVKPWYCLGLKTITRERILKVSYNRGYDFRTSLKYDEHNFDMDSDILSVLLTDAILDYVGPAVWVEPIVEVVTNDSIDVVLEEIETTINNMDIEEVDETISSPEVPDIMDIVYDSENEMLQDIEAEENASKIVDTDEIDFDVENVNTSFSFDKSDHYL